MPEILDPGEFRRFVPQWLEMAGVTEVTLSDDFIKLLRETRVIRDDL